MLKNNDPKKINENFKDLDKGDLALELAVLQRTCIQENIPVLIFVDGWESSGKGYVINELVRELDTKYYRVNVFEKSQLNDEYNYLKQLWKFLPAYGNFGILYRSMYTQLFNDLKLSKKGTDGRIKQIENVERLLYNDNTIILKFFLDIDKKKLKENIEELKDDKFRSFFVTKEDKSQEKDYEKFREHMGDVLNMTNFDYSRWHIVNSVDLKETAKEVLATSIEYIKEEIDRIKKSNKKDSKFKYKQEKSKSSIADMDLSVSLSQEEYDKVIDDLQDRAGELAYELYKKEIPTVLVFEGIDAAGKGGSITKLLRKIDQEYIV